VLSRWISEQLATDASQKFTRPAVTGFVVFTAAVSTTAVPGRAEVTGAPPEVKVNVIVVAGGTPHSESVPEVLAP
jgi:hypothetical protein